MKPARRPPPTRESVQLLLLDSSSRRHRVATLAELPSLLSPGDVVVVNDAATMPGSLRLTTDAGEAVELRLLSVDGGQARAVVFGAGDWRVRTEDRPAPPALGIGAPLFASGERVAVVTARDPLSPRLVRVELGRDSWEIIYRIGRPVQYAHLEDELELWTVQTSYSSRPVAAEMPSAGRPLAWSLILEMRRRGVVVASLTHAAGLSATGDDELDARLPLPERYDIPSRTAEAVNRALAGGGRVIAIGTTVARALESAARRDVRGVAAGSGCATLKLGPDSQLRVVAGILTGMHETGQSHYELLSAFVDVPAIDQAWEAATAHGFLGHELGDVALVAPRIVESERARDQDAGATPRRPRSFSITRAAAMAT